jgi:DNA replication and repair protein RecF
MGDSTWQKDLPRRYGGDHGLFHRTSGLTIERGAFFLRVQLLELKHYRNLTELELICPENLHLFVGPNAQGKTNILESLYVLALGKSHRTRTHQELIQFGQPAAHLKAKVKKEEQLFRLEVQLSAKGKKVSRNGIEQARLSQYIGSLPAVLFAPEDLAIVKGSPQVRRRFLDMEIGQVSPTYVHDLTQLHRLLMQRNSLLKQLGQKRKVQDILRNVLDEQLIALTIPILKKRIHFLHSLQQWVQEIHASITQKQEELVIEYLPSIKIPENMDPSRWTESLQRAIAQVREKEILRGTTLVGPHRDDLRFLVNGLDLRTFGSQGQQRTAALSLKLAEIKLIYQEMGHYPILLLDDVLSELDDARKRHLFETVDGQVQTFVTATSIEGIDANILQRAHVYQVNQGMMQKQIGHPH